MRTWPIHSARLSPLTYPQVLRPALQMEHQSGHECARSIVHSDGFGEARRMIVPKVVRQAQSRRGVWFSRKPCPWFGRKRGPGTVERRLIPGGGRTTLGVPTSPDTDHRAEVL